MSSLMRSQSRHYGSTFALRPIILGLSKVVFLFLSQLSYTFGSPLHGKHPITTREEAPESPKDPEDPSLWIYLGTAVALVLLGGAFAGLTIALMGQDEIYLQVIASSGEGSERKNATRVLRLLKRGKHWVLVTLLLSNVITNETLPIVLDRSLGGGWPAVLSSTVLIVIFGEIAPQSVCVRYGLPIGAWCSPFVFALMWIMAPVAWPTAKLLDRLLGEDHGTTYKKAGLKTLVTLHKTLGTSPDERLNQDEVTIISAVLDLKDKPVGNIMTPMNDVFTMSADTILDEEMMDTILSAGYSRIPIYAPSNPRNFVGMLLVKMLITYDPEDALRVRDFALATLPETRTETSCLDIVNFFQEGKSHMVLVSDFPGEPFGALGVVTLEDVIEELIGEEIIDESDVFIDVHKAIRRLAPAPRTRVPKGEVLADPTTQEDIDALLPEDKDGGPISRKQSADHRGSRKPSVDELGTSPRTTTFYMRRRSSGNRPAETNGVRPVAFRSHTSEIMQHLKHLGPSNAANRPRQTKIQSVKIKPGVQTIPENRAIRTSHSEDHPIVSADAATRGGVGEGLLSYGGREASDGVYAVQQGYGTLSNSPNSARQAAPSSSSQKDLQKDNGKDLQEGRDASGVRDDFDDGMTTDKIIIDHRPAPDSDDSDDTIDSLPSTPSASPKHKKHTARSGSITEQFVDTGGVKKMVLETTSSSDTEDKGKEEDAEDNGKGEGSAAKSKGKKRRKKRAAKKKKGQDDDGDESKPLLGGN